jgi:hypothetical protein
LWQCKGWCLFFCFKDIYLCLAVPSSPDETGRMKQDLSGMGAGTHENWWKWNRWSISQARLLTSTYRT